MATYEVIMRQDSDLYGAPDHGGGATHEEVFTDPESGELLSRVTIENVERLRVLERYLDQHPSVRSYRQVSES